MQTRQGNSLQRGMECAFGKEPCHLTCDGMKCHKTQEMLMNQNAFVNAEKSEINLQIMKSNYKKGCNIQVNNLS